MTTVQALNQGRDLEDVAKAAYLLGNESEGSEFYRRAQEEFLNLGQIQDAARCAFWLGFMSLINRELAVGTGWLSRAERMLAGQPDCCEKGYLLLPIGYRETHVGDRQPVTQHSKAPVRLAGDLATTT